MRKVHKGDQVILRLLGAESDAARIEPEKSTNNKSMSFVAGSGEMVPWIEQAVFGMSVGERKRLSVAADEVFGPSASQGLYSIPREAVDPGKTVRVGDYLKLTTPQDTTIAARVVAAGETFLLLNLSDRQNSRTVAFQIELADIVDASDVNTTPLTILEPKMAVAPTVASMFHIEAI